MELTDIFPLGTSNYYVCPAIIDDEQYLFIDTASFSDPNTHDLTNFHNTVSYLIALGPFVQVVGVLFTIGIPGTRLRQQDVKFLCWVQCFCGPDFLPKFDTRHQLLGLLQGGVFRAGVYKNRNTIRRRNFPPGHASRGALSRSLPLPSWSQWRKPHSEIFPGSFTQEE